MPFYSHILVRPECYWWVWPGGRICFDSASVLQLQESLGGWRRGLAAEPLRRQPPASCCLGNDSERNQQVQCLKEECNAELGSALTASFAAVETFSWGTEKDELWHFTKLTKCVVVYIFFPYSKCAHLPFLVTIISVPTVLNCFHSDAFSSSILTLSCGVPGVSAVAGGGCSSRAGSPRAAMSHVVGYNGTCAAGSWSIGEMGRQEAQGDICILELNFKYPLHNMFFIVEKGSFDYQNVILGTVH